MEDFNLSAYYGNVDDAGLTIDSKVYPIYLLIAACHADVIIFEWLRTEIK